MFKILVQSLHAGSGATTVALNLALALSQSRRGVLCSLCADNSQIMASANLSVLQELTFPPDEAIELSADLLFYAKSLFLKGITPPTPDAWIEPLRSDLETLSQAAGDFLVIDGGPAPSAAAKAAAASVDAVFTVLCPNATGLLSLRNFQPHPHELLLANQVHPDSRTQADVMLFIRAPEHQLPSVPFQLPYDEHVLRAVLENEFLSAAYPDCAFMQSMESLAVYCGLLEAQGRLDLPEEEG